MSEEKEIIIDGVNVKICKHYDIDNNYCDQSYLGEGGKLKNTKNPKKCEQNPNCYYKQLKRTRQMNFELISKANAYDKLVILANDRLDIIDRLKQENEKLRQDWRLDCLKCEYKNTKADVDKYKQALEEIREITEQDRDCINSELACCRLCEKLDLIKEKINEVLNDRD